jgi:hypothetical protein
MAILGTPVQQVDEIVTTVPVIWDIRHYAPLGVDNFRAALLVLM